MRNFLLIFLLSVSLFTSYAYANPFNFFFSALSQPRTIINVGSSKNWSDGTFAKTCNDYRNPPKGYAYKGKTGDGVYTIKPNGAALNVYCDMSTDGGGWTLVVAGRGVFTGANTGGSLLSATSAKSHACLTTGNINDCPVDTLNWTIKEIPATSYFKKMSSGSYQLIAKMKTKANWDTFIAMKQTDTNFDYTYKPAQPSVHFNGYSSDSSGAAGCQDAAIFYNYLFALGDGTTACGGNYSLLYNEVSSYGFLDTITGNGAPTQIFVR